jgi:hypothetical protein
MQLHARLTCAAEVLDRGIIFGPDTPDLKHAVKAADVVCELDGELEAVINDLDDAISEVRRG